MQYANGKRTQSQSPEKLGQWLLGTIKDYADVLHNFKKNIRPSLFQQLGYSYLAGLIDRSTYLIDSLRYIPQEDRLAYLKLIGLERVKSFISKASEQESLFNLMPADSHEQLK